MQSDHIQPPVLTRRYFTRQRRVLSSRQRQGWASQASLHLGKLNQWLPKNAKVAIYYDDFGELPTQPILDWCVRLGYQVYLPVVGNGDKRLKFAPISHKKLLAIRSYRHPLGMKQVHSNQLLWASQLDAIFCPLVAIDRRGIRMGMGGGYYDRSLAKASQLHLPNPLKIGWCYDFQWVDDLVAKPWDVAMDMAIMPSRLIRF